MPLKILTDGNPDGSLIGGSASEKIGFYGAVPSAQPTNPFEAQSGAFGFGSIVTYSSNNCPLANIAVSTTANQANLTIENFNVAGAVGVNATQEFIVGISKATTAANATNNVGLCGWRPSAANTVDLQFANPSGANGNIVANEVQWTVATIRGFQNAIQVVACNANANCPTNGANYGTVEVIYTLVGSGATAVANVSGSGQITGIQVTNSGSGYFTVPTVMITAPANANYSGVTANQPTLLTGTALPFPVPANGTGATAEAIVNSSGQIISVVVTDPGSGYLVSAPPTVTFGAATSIAPGQFVTGQPNAYTAGLGIGNMRVAGKNQIAVQYFNCTGSNIAIPAANYAFVGLSSMPAISPFITIRANVTAANVTAAGSAANSTNYTVPGLMANDVGIASYSAAIPAGANGTAYIQQPPVAAANAFADVYVGSNIASNKAAGVYSWVFMRQQANAPMIVFQAFVSNATAVTAGNTSEQVFTLPSNITLSSSNNATNFNVINCNKPSHTPGLSVVGCRANSNTQVAITYMNTSSVSITPPNEMYTFAYFPTPAATISANVLAYQIVHQAGPTYSQLWQLVTELQQSAQLMGLIKGY